jgi:AcrR family transcriptional regulator
MGEVGYGALTIEAVAARSGVAKSTIYRHWPGKLDLIEDAIRTVKCGLTAPPDGPVEQRVVELLERATSSFADSRWSSCLPAFIDAAERDPEVLAVHSRIAAERRQILIDVLAEGVQKGELSPLADVGLLAESLAAPIIVRRLLLHVPFRPDEIGRLVEQVLGPWLSPPRSRR